MARAFFISLCVVAALLPVGMGMGAAQTAPAPTVDPAPECDSLSEFESTDEYRDCLSEHTSAEELMVIAETDPSNVSTKATDAAMAGGYESKLNDTEEERLTDWMTWHTLGVEPGWLETVHNATRVTESPSETAAPSSSSPTPTSTPAATATPNGTVAGGVEDGSQGEADTMANTDDIRMGEHTSIVGWEFVDSTVRVAIDTERTQRVTITDGAAGVGEAGATKPPGIEERIYGGEISVVTMPVEEAFGGHVVGVSAGDSGIRLSTEMDASGQDPLRHFGGQSGLISGILIAVATSLGGAWYVLYKENDGVVRA